MPHDPHHLHELLAACRPDGRDLREPEMDELARQLEHDEQLRRQADSWRRFDQATGSALHDVPVPAGLATRLHQAVAEAASVERAAAQTQAGVRG